MKARTTRTPTRTPQRQTARQAPRQAWRQTCNAASGGGRQCCDWQRTHQRTHAAATRCLWPAAAGTTTVDVRHGPWDKGLGWCATRAGASSAEMGCVITGGPRSLQPFARRGCDAHTPTQQCHTHTYTHTHTLSPCCRECVRCRPSRSATKQAMQSCAPGVSLCTHARGRGLSCVSKHTRVREYAQARSVCPVDVKEGRGCTRRHTAHTMQCRRRNIRDGAAQHCCCTTASAHVQHTHTHHAAHASAALRQVWVSLKPPPPPTPGSEATAPPPTSSGHHLL
jgi:hypothetical protein